MKKIIALLLLFIAFAFGADYKPFEFTNIDINDSALQQEQFDYMLKYKLFGRDYLRLGNRVIIQDKSGWNGTANNIEIGNNGNQAGISIGGPTLAGGTISVGLDGQFTSGPIRATTINADSRSSFGGYVCLADTNDSQRHNYQGLQCEQDCL